MKSRLGTDGSENKKGVMGANSVVGHWKNDHWCWITGCWISVVMPFMCGAVRMFVLMRLNSSF